MFFLFEISYGMKYLEACVYLLYHRFITLKVACQGHAPFRSLPVLFLGEHLPAGLCWVSFQSTPKRAACLWSLEIARNLGSGNLGSSEVSYVSPRLTHVMCWQTPALHIWQYDNLGQCVIALSWLENTLPHVLEHLNPNYLTT